MTRWPPQSPHALDAEERALARTLPRLHGRTAPGPDLDASILAAAQAAVRPAKPSQRPAKPRIRWIAPASLAASVMLAVGMAWHLRPLPMLETVGPAGQSDTADAVAVRMIESSPNDKPASAMQSGSVPAQADATARQPAASPAIAAQDAEAFPLPPARPREAPSPPPPRRALAEPVSPAAPPSQGHAAPPRSAATMQMGAPARAGSLTGSSARPSAASTGNTLDTQAIDPAVNARAVAPAAASASRDAVARDASSASMNKAGLLERRQQAAPKAVAPAPDPDVHDEALMAADAGFVDDPDEDVPPATVDSPAVRDAWLNRIVELLEQGNRQDARASLAEFRRRYPAATLPPRLRALEIEP